MNRHMQDFVNELGSVKVFVVGRHEPNFGDIGDEIEVVGQAAVTFAATASECKEQLLDVQLEAYRAGAHVLLLQAVPGQLAAALVGIRTGPGRFQLEHYDGGVWPRIGVIINKPGERPAGVVKKIHVQDQAAMAAVFEAVKIANPRAKVSLGRNFVEIKVDPPMRFEFDHIEWI